MRDTLRSRRARVLGLVLLSACTLWLVVQNTLLALAVLWTDPKRVLTVVTALIKVAGAVVTGFWSSPAAALVVAALAIAALLFRAVARDVPAREVRHG